MKIGACETFCKNPYNIYCITILYNREAALKAATLFLQLAICYNIPKAEPLRCRAKGQIIL